MTDLDDAFGTPAPGSDTGSTDRPADMPTNDPIEDKDMKVDSDGQAAFETKDADKD